jgi:2-polyprenyl-3-methyl-5-hydroxy-6-metoxy-1,4-benzoquinol methylase
MDRWNKGYRLDIKVQYLYQTIMNKVKNIDTYSTEALEVMAQAPSFNQWMYEVIRPYISGRILEIGSGTGNISQYFINAGDMITLSDYNQNHLKILNGKFSSYNNVCDILQIDISENNIASHSNLSKSFDTIFLLNVLEHIEKEDLALKNCNGLLKTGGKIIVLVPAYSYLFSKMDERLEHFRRYTTTSLEKVLRANGFATNKKFYFNSLGIAGWFWNKIFKKTEISKAKITSFNFLVPFAKFLDMLFLHRIGLSAVIVAEKKVNF